MLSSRTLVQTSQTHISQLVHFLHQEARVLLANLNGTTRTIKNVKVWVFVRKLKRLQNFDICTLRVASVLWGNKFKILVYKLFKLAVRLRTTNFVTNFLKNFLTNFMTNIFENFFEEFFEEFFWQILFDRLFDKPFLTIFFLFGRFLLTHNLLTICKL